MPSFAASSAAHDCEIVVVQHGFQADVKADRSISTSGEVNYSRMCNLGAAAASGDWLVFLDDQEFPSPGDWLANLAGHVSRADVGVVGGKLSFPSGAVQHAGIVTGMMGGFGYLLWGSFGSPFWPWNDLTLNVSAVSRAFMALRKPVFQELGGFDEEFRSSFGDVDLCWRARALGYEVIYEPAAVLVRDGRPSPRVQSEERVRWRLKQPNLDRYCDPFYSPHLSTRSEDASLREDDPFPPEDTSRAAW
jgi:GT2 family glycosyltransferase